MDLLIIDTKAQFDRAYESVTRRYYDGTLTLRDLVSVSTYFDQSYQSIAHRYSHHTLTAIDIDVLAIKIFWLRIRNQPLIAQSEVNTHTLPFWWMPIGDQGTSNSPQQLTAQAGPVASPFRWATNIGSRLIERAELWIGDELVSVYGEDADALRLVNSSTSVSYETSYPSPEYSEYSEYLAIWSQLISGDRGGYGSPYMQHHSSNTNRNPYMQYSRFNDGTFHFASTIRSTFDLDRDTITDVIRQIKANPGINITFNTVSKQGAAYGAGANRQVYQKLAAELAEYMTETHCGFFDVKPGIDATAFVSIIAMIINAGCFLTHHLDPALMQAILFRDLNLSELEYYMGLIQPDVLKNAQAVTDFAELDTGHDSHVDLYKSLLIRANPLHHTVACAFQSFDSFSDYDAAKLDEIISGPFTITAKQVLQIANIYDQRYSSLWKQFVESLTETELRQMLILFGNSTAIDAKYAITVDHIHPDIQITTCTRSVVLNRKLFESIEVLSHLKYYFTSQDMISDEFGVAPAGFYGDTTASSSEDPGMAPWLEENDVASRLEDVD